MRNLFALLAVLVAVNAFPETGQEAWLRYAPVNSVIPYEDMVIVGKSEVVGTAQVELGRGFRSMLGRELTAATRISRPAIVVGTIADLNDAFHIKEPAGLLSEGYWLNTTVLSAKPVLLVAGKDVHGVLYGVFALLRRMALQQPLGSLNVVDSPSAPVRWTNEWDNPDGSIERGYGGRSIFFADGEVVPDLARVNEYARLLASVGINGCTFNNVNASPRILASDFIPHWARIANVFRQWGIRLSVSVDFSSSQRIGGLNTFDPLDPQVAEWWRKKADEVYRAVPDLAGFLVKADSEGRLGPSTYGRTHADAANLIARALKPHGGILVYRAFVYDHHLDWNDLKADRARAAYDNFAALDGKFDDNVVVQIKYGPIDFQVREPVSPLIGALRHTNQALELQITQEYTGQQRHLCFLAPMWEEILDFDLHTDEKETQVKAISSGRAFHQPIGGFVGVANIGQDRNWLGYDLAQANLYAFGRQAWNPDLSASAMLDEWTRLTFGDDARVVATVTKLQTESWPAYEKYTGSPLGLQTLTNIVGPHYGPGPDSADGNGWGQWIRADTNGIGMDRTVATGTGFAGQYSSKLAAEYESLQSCPDNLVLFFHHVPYSYVLHSGKTVIQTIYDSHYEGAEIAQGFPAEWERLKGTIDDERYFAVLARLEYQAGHAIVWRDAINDWFFRLTGIADEKGRVGHHPGRVEAESMNLHGYVTQRISPWYAASNGEAIECPVASCSASFKFNGASGKYDIAMQYFDQRNGRGSFRVSAGKNPLANWTAGDILPSEKVDSDTSTRRLIRGVTLHQGDEIVIEGTPDGGEKASVDYLEIVPLTIR
jgi:alpha-glucuronidase